MLSSLHSWRTFAVRGASRQSNRFKPFDLHYRGYGSLPDNQPFKVLFLGRDEFSCLVLQELFDAQDVWQSIDIVTHPDESTGRRGSVLSVSPLKMLAQSYNLNVHHIPHSKPDFKRWKPPEPFTQPLSTHILITASFGRILPTSFLSLFPPTSRLNVHPSLLPTYRGPAPIQHAILNGENQTGVSVIQMLKRSEGIDAGRIWDSSTKLSINPNDTFITLRDKLAATGGRLLVSVLRDMLLNKATLKPQDPSLSHSRAPLITFTDSLVDPHSMTASDILRRHRAIGHQRPLTFCLPEGHGKSRTVQLHAPLEVVSDQQQQQPASSCPRWVNTRMVEPGSGRFDRSTDSFLLRCAQNTILRIRNLKQEGKALHGARDWWNGAVSLGMVKDGEIRIPSPPPPLPGSATSSGSAAGNVNGNTVCATGRTGRLDEDGWMGQVRMESALS